MHIRTQFLNRIVAMLLCILLLSNFIFSFNTVHAATYTVDTPYLTYTSNENGEYSTKDGKMIVEFAKGKAVKGVKDYGAFNPLKISIKPKETAIYNITVMGTGTQTKETGQMKYILYNGNGVVRLAARYGGGKYSILTDNSQKNATSIDVLLTEGTEYELKLSHGLSDGVTVVVEKRAIGKEAMAVTNLLSSAVSDKTVEVVSTYTSDMGIVYTNAASYNMEPVPFGFKEVQYSNTEKEDYYNMGNEGLDDDEVAEKGSFLEGILTDLVMMVGTILMQIIEWAIGSNVSLTIDNIVFNKLDQTVIDLTPLGGIEITSNGSTAGMGIFNNANVTNIITQLFNGLKTLAIVVYIVMLLYIGVKILLSIGTKDQSKYLKYIEYWLSGIMILVILPYFLPALPAINNAIVGLMEEEAKSINSNYSLDEVLERLGYDSSYLGEDAEIVEYQELIDDEIARLDAQISNTPGTREEAQANIDAKIAAALDKFHDLEEYEKTALAEKIDGVKEIIDANFDNWTATVQDDYEKAIEDVKDYIFKHANLEVLTDEILEGLPANIKNENTIYLQIKNIVGNIRFDPKLSRTRIIYERSMSSLENVMKLKKFSNDEIELCKDKIEEVRKEYINYTQREAFVGLETLFEDYKNAVIQEEIEELTKMRDSLQKDIMFTLKSKAQKENRFIYAVAWAILLYQVFAILFMYYKRVLAVVVLIVIFPIIMAFYVFDKLGDGKSQSLATWLKEFLAVIFVQVLHASVYIILINIGIDACASNPEKNWFFLMLAVCFLFPGERIMRSIIGLGGSSTLGELRNNVSGAVMLGYAASKGYKAAKKFKQDGGVKGAVDKKKKEHEKKLKQKEEEEAKKKARKSDLERSKQRNREYRAMQKQERDAEKEKRVRASDERIRRNQALSTYDKARKTGTSVKRKITGFKAVKSAKELASKVGNSKVVRGAAAMAGTTIRGVSALGRAGLKGAKFVGKVGSKGYKFAKGSYNIAKKGVGATMGVLEGMENFGQEGFASAIATSTRVANIVGGSSKSNKSATSSNKKQSTAPARYKSKYSNGIKIQNNDSSSSGTNANSGVVVPTMTGGTTTTTTENDYARVRTTYNYSNPTIIDNSNENNNG